MLQQRRHSIYNTCSLFLVNPPNVNRISPCLCRELQRQHQADGAHGVFEGLQSQRVHDRLRNIQLMVEQLLATEGRENPQRATEAFSTSVSEQATHHLPPGEPHINLH